MKQKQKEIESTRYVPPEVSVQVVDVEQGFAASEAGSGTSPWDPQQGRWE